MGANHSLLSWRVAVAVATLIGAGVVVAPSPVSADVGQAGQLCFWLDGDPGDAAIVNLTPVLASGSGDGLLISSDVKAAPPLGANVNFGSGSVDPNVAVARIGADGEVCFQNSVHASVDLIADHLGTIDGSAYSAATASGGSDRRVDTRIGLVKEAPRVVRPQCATPAGTSYSTSTAHTMFGLASRAYEVEPGIAVRGDLLDDIGSATVHFPERMECWELLAALRGGHASLGAITDTEVIVARNVDTDDLAVSFRGTELNFADIITDISATRVPWALPGEGTRANAVHGGFAGAYLAVRDQLLRVLGDEQLAAGDGTRVFFTGHSLGGALATIASIDLVDELIGFGYQRSEVATYTFGAPRSLSREMSDRHASLVPNSHAVVNPNDPVPHVPSAIGTSNPYSHLRSMAVLHGVDGTRTVRRNFGDGRRYGGCTYLIPDLGDHGRGEYDRRVGATGYLPAPSVWVTAVNDPIPFGKDNARMFWSADIEGPCDQVGLWTTSARPTTLSGAVRDRWVIIDTNDQHTTTVNYEDVTWIAYVDMFGKVISYRQY